MEIYKKLRHKKSLKIYHKTHLDIPYTYETKQVLIFWGKVVEKKFINLTTLAKHGSNIYIYMVFHFYNPQNFPTK